jgi:Amt family ammonium transporter
MATQIIGIVSIGIFTVVLSTIGWIVLKAVFGLRPTEEEETAGLDVSELGMDAYPEFKN